MTRRRWRVARHLWEKEEWDLFAVHDIGPDRFHHAFWKYFDPAHPRHPASSPFARLGEEYYRLLDQEIGALLARIGPSVSVLLVSGPGSQAMGGGFAVNDWLLREGFLRLKGPVPASGTPLEDVPIDWSATKVWGAGGYYARLFVNLRGREPHGIVEPSEVPALVTELRTRLSRLRTPAGEPLPVRLFRPSEVYREVHGDPPDLMAYFDETRWRSAGTVGHPQLYLEENDTGPDDAVHSFDGVLAFRDGRSPAGRDLGEQRIVDIAPTVLARFGVAIPSYVQGRPIAALA